MKRIHLLSKPFLLNHDTAILFAKDSNYDSIQSLIANGISAKLKNKVGLSLQVFPSSSIRTHDFEFKDPTHQSYFDPILEFAKFNYEANFPNKHFQNILYSHFTTSTQTVLEEYFNEFSEDLMYFASEMTEGKGRANNHWDSPLGCLMFSMMVQSHKSLQYLFQYVSSLAMQVAISRFIPEAKLKWPNDIYIQNNKVSGVLCNPVPNPKSEDLNSNPKNDKIRLIHGLGTNFSNHAPTTCLLAHNPRITIPELLFIFCAEYTYYHYMLEHDGFPQIKNKFMQNWIHNQDELQIEDFQNQRRKGKIKGISDNGHLEVELLFTKDIWELDYLQYGIDIQNKCVKKKIYFPK